MIEKVVEQTAERSTISSRTGQVKRGGARVKKLVCAGHGTGMLYNLNHI